MGERRKVCNYKLKWGELCALLDEKRKVFVNEGRYYMAVPGRVVRLDTVMVASLVETGDITDIVSVFDLNDLRTLVEEGAVYA